MMKVENIDFENKTFETDNGETFPLTFDVDETITLEEFQELLASFSGKYYGRRSIERRNENKNEDR